MNMEMPNFALRIAVFATLAFVFAPAAFSYDANYRRRLEKWRADYEATLRADDGWLSLAGLFWLKEGSNRFGTDGANEIVLPQDSTLPLAGEFLFHDGKIQLKLVTGVNATVNGEAVTSGDLQSDENHKPDIVRINSLSITVIKRGERYAVRIRDKNNPALRDFKGSKWFPIDENYVLSGRFVRYGKKTRIEIANILGDVMQWESPGYALFQLRGKRLRLDALLDDEKLFFIFSDLTSGKSTYGAGRFLYVDQPKSDRVTLDFNQAINPPCAFTVFATCPLPPRQNRLKVSIEAGEKTYHAAGVSAPNNRLPSLTSSQSKTSESTSAKNSA
jgi:uncharacterized protein (DUF1684 family)